MERSPQILKLRRETVRVSPVVPVKDDQLARVQGGTGNPPMVGDPDIPIGG